MATKKASKKTASKKTTKRNTPAWMKTLPPTIKIRYKGEQLAQKEFYEARANTMKLEVNQVSDMFRAISTGQEDVSIPDDVDKATSTRINKAWAALTKDWNAHKKSVDDEKQAAEDAKNAKEEEQKNAIVAMEKVESKESGKLMKSFTATVDDNVEKIVNKYFEFDRESGSFTIKPGTDIADDGVIADTLGKLSLMSGAAEDISSQAALREAQFVRCIREARPNWVYFFKGRDKDLKRIKAYVGGLDKLDKYGQLDVLKKLPFSTVRPALEARFSKDDEENDKIKIKAIKKIYSDSMKAKKPITQINARNIIADLKGDDNAKKQLRVFYVFILPTGDIEVCGSEKLDDKLLEACTLMIDRGKGTVTTRDDDGNWKAEDIVGPNDDVLAFVDESIDHSDDDNVIDVEEVEEEEEFEEVEVEEEEVEETEEEESDWEEEGEEEETEEEVEEEEDDDDWE